jgi:hypothetical protein
MPSLAPTGAAVPISHLPEPRLLDAAHIIPTFIVGWHSERLRVDLAFGVIVGASAQATAHLIGTTRISASVSLTACSKFMTARSSNSGSSGSSGR